MVVGCWLLVVGCWSLVVGCWSSVGYISYHSTKQQNNKTASRLKTFKKRYTHEDIQNDYNGFPPPDSLLM